MTPSEYLDAAKAKMSVESDYELAKKLESNRGNINEIRAGKRGVPVEMAFRLAITLEMDPATVVADLESQREKNAKRRDFWTGFIRRAAAVAALACTLALSYSGISGEEAAALGGMLAVSSATVFVCRRPRIICIMLNNVCKRDLLSAPTSCLMSNLRLQ